MAMTAAHGLALLGVLAHGDKPVALVAAASVVVFAGGLVVVISAQTSMGASWRVGVDPNERTALVTGGLFRTVRNPIFTGMALCLAAIASSSMSWIAATAVAVFIAGAEVQVRLVEEPHLQRVHGPSFSAYMRHTGRFVPHPATPARDRLAT